MEKKVVPLEEEIQQPHFPVLHEKTAINLLFTGSWFQHEQNQYLKAYDITVTQYNILRILRGQKGACISITAVRERMLERNPDLTRTLDRLLRKALVRREVAPGDRRQAHLFITQAGLDLLDTVGDGLQSAAPGLNDLSDAELHQLNSLLDRVRAREKH
jgi:DNA-binding MarR family transcriptional regulator